MTSGHHFHTHPSDMIYTRIRRFHFTDSSKHSTQANRKLSQPSAHKMPSSQLPRQPFRNILLSLLLLRCFFHNHAGICDGVSILELNSEKLSDSCETAKRVCAEKMGKMAALEGEMDSESNRRSLLMQRRYISYDTLIRDLVPCNMRGASYYNCRDPGMANFYNRGCEVITRCARGD